MVLHPSEFWDLEIPSQRHNHLDSIIWSNFDQNVLTVIFLTINVMLFPICQLSTTRNTSVFFLHLSWSFTFYRVDSFTRCNYFFDTLPFTRTHRYIYFSYLIEISNIIYDHVNFTHRNSSRFIDVIFEHISKWD